MIQLNRNFYTNSDISLQIVFQDSCGNYYVPYSLNYTYLAQNTQDLDTWSCVDSLYKKPVIEPSSVQSLILPSAFNREIPGTTLCRKVLVEWDFIKEGSKVHFVEEIAFTLSTQPVITSVPEEPVLVHPKLVVLDIASSDESNYFYIKFNQPVVNLTECMSIVSNDIPVEFTVKSLNGDTSFIVILQGFSAGVINIKLSTELKSIFNTTLDSTYEHSFEYFSRLWRNPVKIQDYLYSVSVSDLDRDLDIAKELYIKHFRPKYSAADVFYKGQYFCCNYSHIYDTSTSFLVRTEPTLQTFSSLAFLSSCPSLSRSTITRQLPSDLYKLLPFLVESGCNSTGLSVSLVPLSPDPTAYSATLSTTPLLETKLHLPIPFLPRYILDHFSSALEAYKYIRDFVSCSAPYLPEPIVSFDSAIYPDIYTQEYQLLLSASTQTLLVSFLGNAIRCLNLSSALTPSDYPPIVTNFSINQLTVSDMPTDPDSAPLDKELFYSLVGRFSHGLERYSLIYDSLFTPSSPSYQSPSALFEILNQLNYTNKYNELTNPFWFSDYYDPTQDLSNQSDPTEFTSVIESARQAYQTRVRFDPEHANPDTSEPDNATSVSQTSQTIYSFVFDTHTKSVQLITQESAIGFFL